MNKKWIKILSTGMAALMLAACGEKTTEDGAAATEDKDNTAVGSMPDRPFVYVAQQVVGAIDPAKAIDETELIAIANLYDPLIAPERTDGSMTPTPHLAEQYEVSDDGKTYTVSLRDDVTFHSGNILTAEDVVYSMERMLSIGEGNSWLWSGLFAEEGVSVIDDQTVEFQLNKAYAPFVSSLTQLFVVDSQLLKENEQDGDYGQAYLESNDAGSGPYQLDEWNRESEITFAAYDGYWRGWEHGGIKEAEMKFISEESTVKTLLASGQADMVHQYLNPTAFEEFKSQQGIVVQEDPSAMIMEMPINTQKAPTDDINVRKALATAFDYETLADQILMGATQAEGPVPPMVDGHSGNVTLHEKNIEQAKKYLEDSKYAGEELTITMMYLGDVADQRQTSQLVKSNLEEIGVDVEFVQATWPQVTEAAANPETTANLTIISDTLKYPHVDSHTFGKYHPSTHGSYRSAAWLDDADVTAKLEEARSETDVETQLGLYAEAQDLITELTPSIYMANTTHRIAYRDYVKGYEFVPLMGFDISFYSFTTE